MIATRMKAPIRPGVWFAGFVILHVLCWTLAPALLRLNLAMDAMEGTTWGHQLILGYDKNPFLNAWLTRLALFLGGGADWMIYFFSQLSVGICFWAVWALARKMLQPVSALIAVMMLEGLQYYNFHALDFNDNTLELSLWALTVFFYYEAVVCNRLRDWALAGCFAGLALMAKYYSVLLLVSLLFFPVLVPDARRMFREKGFYFAAMIFLLMILPHVCWLFFHDFVTVRYVGARVGSGHHWTDHWYYPAQFVFQQLEVLLPGLILLLPLWRGRQLLKTANTENAAAGDLLELPVRLSAFKMKFLWCAGLLPLLLTLLLSLIAGFKLRAGWGQPLLSYAGVILLASWRPVITRQSFARFVKWLAVFFVALLAGYTLSMWRARSTASAIFPGKTIARRVENAWHAAHSTKLQYIAGPRWLAGNIAFYGKDHPAVYAEWNALASPWIDEQQLRAAGAVFVWDAQAFAGEQRPAVIQQRFPRLGPVQHWQFAWQRNQALPPVDVWLAFLPPYPSGKRPDSIRINSIKLDKAR